MTLRDLSPQKLYNLRRRSEKERRIAEKRNTIDTTTWRIAYNLGLKAGLDVLDTPTPR